MLHGFDDVTVVGEAANGTEAVQIIEKERPDLALLDLQMPELDGLDVVRMLRKRYMPLVAFVTAYDEYAVRAFELNAVDYLLKPVNRSRLRETLHRARERLERADFRQEQITRVRAATAEYEGKTPRRFLDRIPVRQRDQIVILPVRQLASVVAEGELLHLFTTRNERHTITYRLKDLERDGRHARVGARAPPSTTSKFVRLGRGTLANLDLIGRINAMPGGTHVVVLSTGQELSVSRLQSRILRDRLMKL